MWLVSSLNFVLYWIDHNHYMYLSLIPESIDLDPIATLFLRFWQTPTVGWRRKFFPILSCGTSPCWQPQPLLPWSALFVVCFGSEFHAPSQKSSPTTSAGNCWNISTRKWETWTVRKWTQWTTDELWKSCARSSAPTLRARLTPRQSLFSGGLIYCTLASASNLWGRHILHCV